MVRTHICAVIGSEDLARKGILSQISPIKGHEYIEAVMGEHDVIYLHVPHIEGYFHTEAIQFADSVLVVVTASCGVELIPRHRWEQIRALGLPFAIVLCTFDKDTEVDFYVHRLRELFRSARYEAEGYAPNHTIYSPQKVYILTTTHKQSHLHIFDFVAAHFRLRVKERLLPSYLLLNRVWPEKFDMLVLNDQKLSEGDHLMLNTSDGMQRVQIEELEWLCEDNLYRRFEFSGTGVVRFSLWENVDIITTTRAFKTNDAACFAWEVMFYSLCKYPRYSEGVTLLSPCLGNMHSLITFCQANGIQILRAILTFNAKTQLPDEGRSVIIAFGLNKKRKPIGDDVILQDKLYLDRLFDGCRNHFNLQQAEETKTEEVITSLEHEEWEAQEAEWDMMQGVNDESSDAMLSHYAFDESCLTTKSRLSEMEELKEFIAPSSLVKRLSPRTEVKELPPLISESSYQPVREAFTRLNDTRVNPAHGISLLNDPSAHTNATWPLTSGLQSERLGNRATNLIEDYCGANVRQSIPETKTQRSCLVTINEEWLVSTDQNPLIFGVCVISGTLRLGVRLCVRRTQQVIGLIEEVICGKRYLASEGEKASITITNSNNLIMGIDFTVDDVLETVIDCPEVQSSKFAKGG